MSNHPIDHFATEQERDILFTEAGMIRDMVRDLNRDIDAGKQPDGPLPRIYREDRGKRMTLKVARARLVHIEARLAELTKRLAT